MLLAILVLLSLLTPAKGADAPPIQCFPMEHLSGVVEANPGWRILPALSDAENAAALEISGKLGVPIDVVMAKVALKRAITRRESLNG